MEDVAMTLAILFFCLLVLSSAAVAFLLIRYCLRRTTSAVAPLAAREPEPAAAKEPRRLTWREVEALTAGFDEAAVVGRGGSSTVYLARLRNGAPVAVKVHRWCGGGERRLRAFRQELHLLRRLHHPNIVALLAYSDDHGDEEGGALVLEYLAGGTLADRLHGGSTAPLPWAHRMRIVHDVACALEHDVYSFGVLLLEAITGLPAAGSGGGSKYLTARVLTRLMRTQGVDDFLIGLVDCRLGEEYDVEEAGDVARIAVECVGAQPGLRPTMEQVRAAIAEKAARSIAKAVDYGHHVQLSKLLELT